MKIDNKQARALWLSTNGLGVPDKAAPTAPTAPVDTLSVIRRLGFVQLDTIRNITRAHNHIVWSRNPRYREGEIWSLLAQDRALFEHFTHDASVLPMELYPVWQRQFRRMGDKVKRTAWYQTSLSHSAIADIKARIVAEGPLSTRDFDTQVEGAREMWARPPHKKALDALWYAGELTTAHRQNFIKYYDLPDRVIPPAHYEAEHTDDHQIDFLCDAALDRLSFGSLGDIQRFWDAVSAAEVKAWAGGTGNGMQPVQVQADDGAWMPAFAPPDIQARLDGLVAPATRMRIINPFDPAVRDRTRLKRLFGFDYKNEMFVPAAKRQWGYYVYPLLEGDRFVGRIEARADRASGVLTVVNLWREPHIKWSDARAGKLEAELARLAKFIAAERVEWVCLPRPK